MKKYEVTFCSCGSIHFIPWEAIEVAIEKDEEVVLICGHCGAACRIGADDYFDDGKAMYKLAMPNSVGITTTMFTNNAPHKNFSRIIYDVGVKVPMMTGGYAKFHSGDVWYDTDNPLTDYKLQELHSYEKIMEYYTDWERRARTVNMTAFKRALNPGQMEALKGYYITAFNWKEG